MGWFSLAFAAIGLAREFVKYLREKQACEHKEIKDRLKIAKKNLHHARMNGSYSAVEALFVDQKASDKDVI